MWQHPKHQAKLWFFAYTVFCGQIILYLYQHFAWTSHATRRGEVPSAEHIWRPSGTKQTPFKLRLTKMVKSWCDQTDDLISSSANEWQKIIVTFCIWKKITGKAKKCFSSQNLQTGCDAHPASYYIGTSKECRSYEWVELYHYLHNMPSWVGRENFYNFKHFIFVSTVHVMSHSSPFGTLSLLCHHPPLYLSNSIYSVTLPYISPLPTILGLLFYPEERSNKFPEGLIHIYTPMGSHIPSKITVHIHLSNNLTGLKHKGSRLPVQQRM